MEPDRLKDLAAIERELQREQDRPAVWAAVVRGQIDPWVAASQRAEIESASQLARDQALFQPMASELRERLLDQVLSGTQPSAIFTPLRRRLLRGLAATGSLAAAAGLLLFLSQEPPFAARSQEPIGAADDLVRELPANIQASVEIHGGSPGVREDPPLATPPGTLRLPASRKFRMEVRVAGRDFELHSIILHCPGADNGPKFGKTVQNSPRFLARDSRLTFSMLLRQRGLVEADVQPGSVSEACTLEVQVRIGADVFRVPDSSARAVGFTGLP
jgi:hypothetical protein